MLLQMLAHSRVQRKTSAEASEELSASLANVNDGFCAGQAAQQGGLAELNEPPSLRSKPVSLPAGGDVLLQVLTELCS